MKSAGLLILMVGNGVILFFLSTLAVGGNGNADGVYLIWITGSAWMISVAVAAIVLQAKGNSEAAFGLTFLTVPGYLAAFFAIFALSSLYDKLKPNSAEFATACANAGAKYLQPPAKAVESIAFDWEPEKYPPSSNRYQIDARGSILEEYGGVVRVPMNIRFIENRCCQYEGRPVNGVGPYIRRADPLSNTHKYEGVTDLSADILVKYSVSTTSKDEKVWLTTVDTTVTDRRDLKLLATWRYIVNHPARRACGVTSEMTLDMSEFLLRATAQK